MWATGQRRKTLALLNAERDVKIVVYVGYVFWRREEALSKTTEDAVIQLNLEAVFESKKSFIDSQAVNWISLI